MSVPSTGSKNGLSVLRSLARTREQREYCELCGVIVQQHPHLLQRSNGQILCACEACAILFSHRSDSAKFVRIPRDVRRLANFRICDVEWNSLLLPIDLAFFVNSSVTGRVIAYYPSPAGSTESLLNLNAWRDITANNPALDTMQPDVEAFLVNRTRTHREYYIAPIDECYKLTGIIRIHWRGLSGGDEVWQQIDEFFDALRERSVEVREVASA